MILAAILILGLWLAFCLLLYALTRPVVWLVNQLFPDPPRPPNRTARKAPL